jgi:hypothetical protein
MSIEAMKQAVEAFEHIKKYVTDDGAMPENWDAYHEKEYFALEALRQAIEKAEKQEKLCKYCGGIGRVVCDGKCMPEQAQKPDAWIESVCALLRQAHDTLSLASLPTKREWVGLNEKEIKKVFEADWNNPSCPEWVMEFSKRIEAKIKEKNNV